MNYCRCNVPTTTKLLLSPRPHFKWGKQNTVEVPCPRCSAPESLQQSIEFQTCQSALISTLWWLLLRTLNSSAFSDTKTKMRPRMSLVRLVIFYANYTSPSMAERRRVTLHRPFFDANPAWRVHAPCNLLNKIKDTLPINIYLKGVWGFKNSPQCKLRPCKTNAMNWIATFYPKRWSLGPPDLEHGKCTCV